MSSAVKGLLEILDLEPLETHNLLHTIQELSWREAEFRTLARDVHLKQNPREKAQLTGDSIDIG